ncbi:hypothetical protein PHYPSEUDO_004746 [Phytophthora pseudosyringae]|uniref:Uncharacterized protein n=1 Tax=Phytophthora pseudosyringae TaxID=221518 RepID=A0A8T1VMN5_9STRA|nr:hypothetical protein PHYPSEUDO_004746 [Phytophthora pseudosyringae]
MKAALLLTTICLRWYGAMAMEVWLYSRGSNAKFTIDTVQRCYTVQDLWNDRAVRTTWKKLAKGTSLMFYKHARCVAPKVKMEEKTSGSFSFEKEDKLYIAVSSFMVQKDSENPTNGLVEIEVDYPDSIFEGAEANGTASYNGNLESN